MINLGMFQFSIYNWFALGTVAISIAISTPPFPVAGDISCGFPRSTWRTIWARAEVCPISMDQVAVLAMQLDVPKVRTGRTIAVIMGTSW
jgi:hypothetical protein